MDSKGLRTFKLDRILDSDYDFSSDSDSDDGFDDQIIQHRLNYETPVGHLELDATANETRNSPVLFYDYDDDYFPNSGNELECIQNVTELECNRPENKNKLGLSLDIENENKVNLADSASQNVIDEDQSIEPIPSTSFYVLPESTPVNKTLSEISNSKPKECRQIPTSNICKSNQLGLSLRLVKCFKYFQIHTKINY